jgi:hypothetical protein
MYNSPPTIEMLVKTQVTNYNNLRAAASLGCPGPSSCEEDIALQVHSLAACTVL